MMKIKDLIKAEFLEALRKRRRSLWEEEVQGRQRKQPLIRVTYQTTPVFQRKTHQRLQYWRRMPRTTKKENILQLIA